MSSHREPNGQELSHNTVVKTESPSSGQGFNGGSPQWAPDSSQCQSLGRLSSPHAHSPIASHSSPKVEHQLYREREESTQDRKRPKIRDFGRTVSCQMQSQLLSPRGGAGSAGLALTRGTSLPVSAYSESHISGDRSGGQVSPPGPRLTHTVSGNPLDEPSPLGLTLRKTPSLLDLISMKLAQVGAGDQGSGSSDAAQDSTKSRAAKCLVSSSTAQDKLKASNFPASSLKVGTWERMSRYEGDLVGKCYYAKRKLVWEVLESGLKSKIEIQWSDISAMKANCADNHPGTLEIEVLRPPLFFRETNPQPRKHTLWQATSDFTGGQATICKRHLLQFPEGVLNRHYEKLIQCDARLKSLVEGPAPLKSTPEFDHAGGWMLDVKHQRLRTHQAVGHHSSPHDAAPSQSPFVHAHVHALPPGGPGPHSEMVLDSKPDVRLMKIHSSNLASPSSVMDTRGSDESGTSDTEDLRLREDLNEYDGIDFTYPNPQNMRIQDLSEVNPFGNLSMVTENMVRPDQNILDEITRVLFSESASLSHEQTMMFTARVGQMSDALAEEFQQSSSQAAEAQYLSDGNHLQPFSSFQVKSEMDQEDYLSGMMMDSGDNDAMISRPVHRDPSFNSLMSCFSKHGSAGDLLMNLPRVASFPQLFDTSSQAPTIARYDSPYMRPTYFGSEKSR